MTACCVADSISLLILSYLAPLGMANKKYSKASYKGKLEPLNNYYKEYFMNIWLQIIFFQSPWYENKPENCLKQIS